MINSRKTLTLVGNAFANRFTHEFSRRVWIDPVFAGRIQMYTISIICQCFSAMDWISLYYFATRCIARSNHGIRGYCIEHWLMCNVNSHTVCLEIPRAKRYYSAQIPDQSAFWAWQCSDNHVIIPCYVCEDMYDVTPFFCLEIFVIFSILRENCEELIRGAASFLRNSSYICMRRYANFPPLESLRSIFRVY